MTMGTCLPKTATAAVSVIVSAVPGLTAGAMASLLGLPVLFSMLTSVGVTAIIGGLFFPAIKKTFTPEKIKTSLRDVENAPAQTPLPSLSLAENIPPPPPPPPLFNWQPAKISPPATQPTTSNTAPSKIPPQDRSGAGNTASVNSGSLFEELRSTLERRKRPQITQ